MCACLAFIHRKVRGTIIGHRSTTRGVLDPIESSGRLFQLNPPCALSSFRIAANDDAVGEHDFALFRRLAAATTA